MEVSWCDGRPGWHIECSVMSRKYLGETIDIHAGGEDLIFPHHENEIAQSECANGKPFVHYWMHNAFLNIDNHKMSKSLGNFKTVRDIDEQYDPQVLRYLMLSAHYRSPLNFSAELMESAKASYERIVICMENLNFRLAGAKKAEAGTAKAVSEEETKVLQEAEKCRSEFEAAMDDDFNTADALAGVFNLVKVINTGSNEQSSAAFLESLKKELNELCGVLGLIAERTQETSGEEAAWVEKMIQERQDARKARDFARADAIRDELKEKGIVLEDTRDGVKWKKA